MIHCMSFHQFIAPCMDDQLRRSVRFFFRKISSRKEKERIFSNIFGKCHFGLGGYSFLLAPTTHYQMNCSSHLLFVWIYWCLPLITVLFVAMCSPGFLVPGPFQEMQTFEANQTGPGQEACIVAWQHGGCCCTPTMILVSLKGNRKQACEQVRNPSKAARQFQQASR